MRYLRWIAHLMRPYGLAMAAMMFCHIMLAGCAVGFVYVCKRLVDVAVAIASGLSLERELVIWFSVLASVVAMRLILNALRLYLQTSTEINMKNDLRRKLFDTLLHVQSDGDRSHHSGDILNRIQEDVRVISSAISISLPNLIGTCLQFLAALAFLLYLDVKLAAIILIVVPFGVFLGKYITGKIRHLTLDIRNNDSKVQAHLQESIQHRTLLQTMEYSDTSADELTLLQETLYNSEIRRTRFSIVSRMFIGLAFQAGYVVAFMWGVLGISTGTVTYGMMTAFLQLVGQIQRPLLDMSSQIPSLIHSTASIDRIVEIERLPQEEVSDPILLESPAGISLENVVFSYPDSSKRILDVFSFDFKPGSRTAIVGPTGVGKSTMIRLLLSLLKPQEGLISMYSKGEKVSVSAATRCNLVYVPQGNSLFSGSVRDNLLMGNPEASEDQMRDALHIAAADFVMQLPGGLDAQCFEGGAGLSEGQAQRIAIARALLRPGSILLLDEFSSALDAETENILMERLSSSLPGHTMIFITHREKILNYCDSILRLSR